MKKSLPKTVLVILALWMTAGINQEAEAQMNRREIKRNNKRISKFKGARYIFAKANRYSYAGVTLNALNYFGDLSPLPGRFSTDLKFTRPALGLTYGQRFGPFYTLRAQFTYGVLRGDDFKSADPFNESSRYRYVRNLHFRNIVKELSVTAVFDLYRNEHSYVNRVIWTPYAYIGAALYHHNPKAKVNENSTLPEAGQWVSLQPLGTEGQYSELPETAENFGLEPYTRIQVSVPFGVGLRYKLNDKLDFSFETGTRILFTDYIDDVSGHYVDLEHLPSDLSREMSDRSQETTNAVSGEQRDMEAVLGITGAPQPAPGGYMTYGGFGREHPDNLRGNKDRNDLYFVTTFRVTYIMGKNYRRAKFR